MSSEMQVLESLREAHTALLSDLQGLEWMARSPTTTTGEELANRLRGLRADVARHFHLEEQDGYLSPALDLVAATHRKAQELLDEHGSLLQSLDNLIQKAVQEGRQNTTLWESVQHWVDRIRQHELRENELFEEARDEDSCCRRD